MQKLISSLVVRLGRLALLLSLLALAPAAGCGAPPPEDVGSTQQALYSCPEKYECYELCESRGENWYWGGLCKDDGACRCQYDRGFGGGGGGGGGYWACYVGTGICIWIPG